MDGSTASDIVCVVCQADTGVDDREFVACAPRVYICGFCAELVHEVLTHPVELRQRPRLRRSALANKDLLLADVMRSHGYRGDIAAATVEDLVKALTRQSGMQLVGEGEVQSPDASAEVDEVRGRKL